MKIKDFLVDTKGTSIAIAIFVTFLLLVCLIIVNMSLGPVLMEVVSFSNSYMESNPSELMGEWRVSLNSALRYYAASTFILALSLCIWLFITSIRKEWKTFYR